MKNKEQLLNKDNWVQYLKLAIEGGLTINAIANDIVFKIDKALTPTTEEVNKFLDDNYPTETFKPFKGAVDVCTKCLRGGCICK